MEMARKVVVAGHEPGATRRQVRKESHRYSYSTQCNNANECLTDSLVPSPAIFELRAISTTFPLIDILDLLLVPSSLTALERPGSTMTWIFSSPEARPPLGSFLPF